jgi:hypothetical protein
MLVMANPPAGNPIRRIPYKLSKLHKPKRRGGVNIDGHAALRQMAAESRRLRGIAN